MEEKKLFVGVGLDANGITRALGRTGKESLRGSSLMDVARALMAVEKDIRVEVHNVTVESVNVDSHFPSQVQIELLISWSLYHGCEDKNEADDEYVSEIATYTKDGHLIFQVPEPRRPRNDC
jgi:hypothetical protein